jgi:preprotein translocase subunit SecA
LTVIGTERHESRRIDNQLRGRCARQGDKGASRFYVALDDELMRLFGSERIASVMTTLGMQDGEAIESRIISKQIEGAQRRVEGHNFDIRKHLLDYDKVMNQQRTAVYGLRNAILDGDNCDERIQSMIEETAEDLFNNFYNNKTPQASDFSSLNAYFNRVFTVDLNLKPEDANGKNIDALLKDVREKINKAYEQRANYFKEQGFDFDEIERTLMLQILDQAWKQHLYELDQLQKSVGLRGYAQKDPLIEYQKESFSLYQGMMSRVRDFFVEYTFRLQLPPKRTAAEIKREQLRQDAGEKGETIPDKIGRNDPCPCGSGKKYKKCCGQ